MLFLELQELIEKAAQDPKAEAPQIEKSAAAEDEVDQVCQELERLLAGTQLEKRASRTGLAKLMLALDLLSDPA